MPARDTRAIIMKRCIPDLLQANRRAWRLHGRHGDGLALSCLSGILARLSTATADIERWAITHDRGGPVSASRRPVVSHSSSAPFSPLPWSLPSSILGL